ncbi:LuxR family transcriptional regulator [Pseudomonas fluorescens ABAC62]|nr:LuxR family transcriptional regulator [Pseudomonas fluorescens ABAC62]
MKWSVVSPLRVSLLDDHAVIRDALKIRLSLEADLKVVGVYGNSRDLIEGLRDSQTDLLLLDYQLGDGEIDGFRLIQTIRIQFPTLRIIIFSSAEKAATVSMCIRAGVNGFVGKSQETDELLKAIRTVALDRIYLSPAISAQLHKLPSAPLEDHLPSSDAEHAPVNLEGLSPKELEVLRCYLEGMSVTQMATKFSRSTKTISGQKQSALRKLGIRTDAELHKMQAQVRLF